MNDCALYKGTIKPALLGSTSSTSIDGDCCYFPEILCINNRITEINAEGQREWLKGEIPRDIGQLSFLVKLTFSQNQLRGRIPVEIGMLIMLEDLSVSNNQLDGDIPAQIGQMSKLKRLDVSQNNLIGPIPPQLGLLRDLEYVNLSGNQFSGAVPIFTKVKPNNLIHDPHNSISNDLPVKDVENSNKMFGFAIENNTLLFAPIVCFVLVLIIIALSAIFYYIKKSHRVKIDLKSFRDEQVLKSAPQVIVPAAREKLAQRSKVFRSIQQRIPEALAKGIPDRLYYFSYNQGIEQFNELLRYLFMSTNTCLLAGKPFKPVQVGEIDVQVGDELFIEKHTMDGWCTGFNSTQDTIGLFPLYCTSPRYPIILTLVHIGGGPGEISESIINSCVAFPHHISYRILDRMPPVAFLASLFAGSRQCLTKCIVSGDEIFLNDIEEAFGAAIIEGVDVPMVDEVLI